MNEDERDRILLLEQIDNLSWERDRLREALREVLDGIDSIYGTARREAKRARAALGEGSDGS